ncbi:unnamed protein product [Symbiodinium sp. KB8]|nr:unnamed protein product [Symbiodinium sp. KB8]
MSVPEGSVPQPVPHEGPTSPTQAGTPVQPTDPNAIVLQQLAAAVSQLAQASASSQSSGRYVKAPEVFAPKTMDEEQAQWSEWAFAFKNWMCVQDEDFRGEVEKAEALVKFPPFKEGGSLLDYTLAYERLLNEYQKVAPHPYDDNLKISTLLAGLPADIRRYLQLSMDKDVTYEKLRTRLLSYERTTAAWSSEHVLRSIGIDKDAAKFVDTGGLAPMDVDRVEDKGKGKKGDKGKGKKGGKDGGRPSLGNKPFCIVLEIFGFFW